MTVGGAIFELRIMYTFLGKIGSHRDPESSKSLVRGIRMGGLFHVQMGME